MNLESGDWECLNIVGTELKCVHYVSCGYDPMDRLWRHVQPGRLVVEATVMWRIMCVLGKSW